MLLFEIQSQLLFLAQDQLVNHESSKNSDQNFLQSLHQLIQRKHVFLFEIPSQLLLLAQDQLVNHESSRIPDQNLLL